MSGDTAPCPICGSREWVALPDPGPRSMASDFRIVEEPLGRRACRRCGLAERAVKTTPEFFERGYSLYAHAPDAIERRRQAAYAEWIAAAVATPPRRVLDVGCGNGSLLLALRERWPSAELLGCDASAESVAHGAPPLRLRQGTSADLDATIAADLVVSVNVIEHTPDPQAFARDLRRAAAPDGTIVVVCPDASRPGVELLFSDHLWSLTPWHVAGLLAREGAEPCRIEAAPAGLGEFQLVAGRARSRPSARATPVDAEALNARRAAYLERWRTLDARLVGRLPGDAICFGAGEAAALLRAYAPRTWGRVRACTADDANAGGFGDLPVVPLHAVPADAAILLGVRAADQPRVAARLRERFARVATWYDLLEDER